MEIVIIEDYTYEDIIKNYIPDFIITYFNKTKEIVEIKPQSLVDYGSNPIKFNVLKTYLFN